MLSESEWQKLLTGRVIDRRELRKQAKAHKHWTRMFRLSAALTLLLLMLGLGVFAWAGIQQHVSAREQAQVASTAGMSLTPTDAVAKAHAYNQQLAQKDQVLGEVLDPFTGKSEGDFTATDDKEYQSLLNYGDGVMGELRIPKINVDLPIRHGAGQYALENGVGHLHGSSLPVGGASTHTVLTGHRGMADKALFTDLDKLTKGDPFYLTVGGRTIAYKVTQIQVVKPDKLDTLRIQPGKDLATLVTCTPLFVNTDRLLVTGTRAATPYDVPYVEQAEQDARNPLIPAILAATGATVCGITLIIVFRNRKPTGQHVGNNKR